MKFVANDNDLLIASEYEVGASLKEMFTGENANNVNTVKMKIKNVHLSYIADTLTISYGRYLSFDNTNDSNIKEIKNKKTGNFPTKEVVFKKRTLRYFQLNFVNLSYGNEFDFGDDTYDIPVEFVQGQDVMENHFKFFLKYDDDPKPTSNDTIIIHFQFLDK